MTKLAYNVEEAAHVTGLPPRDIRELVRGRVIERVRFGSRIVIPAGELERFIRLHARKEP